LGQLYMTEKASQIKRQLHNTAITPSFRETSKIRVCGSKTRDGITYRATAAASLGAAGDGRGAFGTGAVHVEYERLLVVCG
jgi:hypothetical protein